MRELREGIQEVKKWFRWDIAISSLVINLLTLALPIVLLQIYDRIIPNVALSTFNLLLFGLIIVLILDSTLRVSRFSITSWLGAKFEHVTSCSAFEKMLKTNILNYEKDAAGIQLDRISSIDHLKEFYANQAIIALLDLPFVIIFISLIWFIGGPIAIVPIVIIFLFAGCSYYVGEKLRHRLKKRSETDDRRYNFIIDVITGIHNVKGLAFEQQMVRRYERLIESSAESGQEITYYSSLAQNIGGFFSQVTLITVASIGSIMVLNNNLTIGTLAACTILSARSIQPLLRIMGIWTYFQNIRLAKDRLNKIINLPSEVNKGNNQFDKVENSIELKGISFSYPNTEKQILKSIDLTVPAFETVAIKGESGSGKSTFAQIIAGLIPPDKGKISIDGKDISDYEMNSLRQNIAYLPQQSTLFQGTILENLIMFRDENDLEKAIPIAENLGLVQDLAHLPEGLETRVGDVASNLLPASIKQRIAIVRALSYHPSVVVFDEANTGLDFKTDQSLIQLLKRIKKEKTLVIVSHRPSYLDIADHVYALKDGFLEKVQTSKNKAKNNKIVMTIGDDK